MELSEILRTRRSVRRFEPRAVERHTLDRLVAAAFTAPSSRNSRSTRLMVVSDPERMARIARMRDYGSAFMTEAPAAILVAGDETVSDLWEDNASITATVLQLAAVDAGLGSCWVHIHGRPHLKEQPAGMTAEAYLRTFLPLPQPWRPLCFIALGYAAETPQPHRPATESERVIWL